MPLSRNTDMIVGFDQHGAFEVLDAELAEITSVDALEQIGGGIFDGACANLNTGCGANAACYNELNGACPNTQLNGACIKPNQGC